MAEDSLISKNTKQTVTFASALFFSFNILFFLCIRRDLQ